jgi:hypothetical protein
MTIYDVIDKVKNMDNIDKIDVILSRECFQTSWMTDDIKKEIQKASLEFLAMGETDLYNWAKNY